MFLVKDVIPLARYLSGYSKRNVNKDNIDAAIERAKSEGCELNEMDIKVLKYLYALNKMKGIPITSTNLASIYQTDKSNKFEENFRGKDGETEKKYAIESSLRKLQNARLITVNYNDGTYSLLSKYTDSEVTPEAHIPNQYFRTTDEMLAEFLG